MSGELLKQQLVEASELLEIVEAYFDNDSLDSVAINGLRVLLRESRMRVLKASKGFESNGIQQPKNSSAGKSLAARIKRLPQGEFRSIELNLDSESDEFRG